MLSLPEEVTVESIGGWAAGLGRRVRTFTEMEAAEDRRGRGRCVSVRGTSERDPVSFQLGRPGGWEGQEPWRRPC